MGKSPPSYQESIQKKYAINSNKNVSQLNSSNNSHTNLSNQNLDTYGYLNNNNNNNTSKNIAYENSFYEINPTINYLQKPPSSSLLPQYTIVNKKNNLNDSSSSSTTSNSLSYPFMRNLLNEFNSQSSSSSSGSSNGNSLNTNNKANKSTESPIPPAYTSKQQQHYLQPPQPSPTPLNYNFQLYSPTPTLSSNSSSKQNNDIESEFANLTLSIEREIEKHKQVNNEYYGQCYKCGKGVNGRNEACQAMGNIYHANCFTCVSCSRTLRGKSFYNINNQIYCEEDYLVSLIYDDCKKFHLSSSF
jgi:hypothetical protein